MLLKDERRPQLSRVWSVRWTFHQGSRRPLLKSDMLLAADLRGGLGSLSCWRSHDWHLAFWYWVLGLPHRCQWGESPLLCTRRLCVSTLSWCGVWSHLSKGRSSRCFVVCQYVFGEFQPHLLVIVSSAVIFHQVHFVSSSNRWCRLPLMYPDPEVHPETLWKPFCVFPYR